MNKFVKGVAVLWGKINDFGRGLVIGFCAGIIVAGLAAGLVTRHKNKQREIIEYVEKQQEIETLREDYSNRDPDEFLSDPAVRGAVDGAAGEFERKRDELLQRFRGELTR
jgi:hypothetical protein